MNAIVKLAGKVNTARNVYHFGIVLIRRKMHAKNLMTAFATKAIMMLDALLLLENSVKYLKNTGCPSACWTTLIANSSVFLKWYRSNFFQKLLADMLAKKFKKENHSQPLRIRYTASTSLAVENQWHVILCYVVIRFLFYARKF